MNIFVIVKWTEYKYLIIFSSNIPISFDEMKPEVSHIFLWTLCRICGKLRIRKNVLKMHIPCAHCDHWDSPQGDILFWDLVTANYDKILCLTCTSSHFILLYHVSSAVVCFNKNNILSHTLS